MTLNVVPWGENPSFEWDEYNEREIAKHHVTCMEVEECFEQPYWCAPHNKAKSEPEEYSDRYRIKGQTDGGRKLFVIVRYRGGEVIRPITAFDQ